AGRQGRRTIKDSNIVQSEEATLKNVHAIGIFTIDPPREIQQELVKHFFEECAVGYATHTTVDFIYPPSCPRVHRRVHIAESPLVGRQLPVWMHVPFTD